MSGIVSKLSARTAVYVGLPESNDTPKEIKKISKRVLTRGSEADIINKLSTRADSACIL